jgi:hypothetical protein
MCASSLVHAHEPYAAPQPLATISPAIVEYRWTLSVPHWVVDVQKYDTRVFVPSTRPKRIDYGFLDFEMQPRKIGQVPEFSCKYADLVLPERCTTTWRDVIVDVAVPVIRHDYVEVDVLDGSWQDQRVSVEVPRVVWTEETLFVSLPAVAVRMQPSREVQPVTAGEPQ